MIVRTWVSRLPNPARLAQLRAGTHQPAGQPWNASYHSFVLRLRWPRRTPIASGSGKTRLALEVAASVREQFTDGFGCVELAGIADPDLVPMVVASALRVREMPGRHLVETLRQSLRGRALLLVLDNCEIAAGLVISERTAENHVQRLLNVLALGSRVQVAAWAVQNGIGR